MELLHFTANLHYYPYVSDQRDSMHCVVTQWYLENLRELHLQNKEYNKANKQDRTSTEGTADDSTFPTSLRLVLFFMTLNSSDLCQYNELMQGGGIATMTMRHRMQQLELIHGGEKLAHEFIRNADPKQVNAVNTGTLQYFDKMEMKCFDGIAAKSMDMFGVVGIHESVVAKFSNTTMSPTLPTLPADIHECICTCAESWALYPPPGLTINIKEAFNPHIKDLKKKSPLQRVCTLDACRLTVLT